MALKDIVVAALSHPAGQVIDRPVRELVDEVLADRGYAAPDEVQALRDAAASLERMVTRLSERVEAAEAAVEGLRATVSGLEEELSSAEAQAADAEIRVLAAVQGADQARAELSRLQTAVQPLRVGASGEVSVDGVAFSVDASLAGKPYTVSGKKVRRVYVGGKAVRKRPATG